MSIEKSDNIKHNTKKFDYKAIADRLRTVSWSYCSNPTGDVNRSTGPTFQLPATVADTALSTNLT